MEEQIKKLKDELNVKNQQISLDKEEIKENTDTKKKKEKKKIVFMEKTEEIPNVEFPGEIEFNKEEHKKQNNKQEDLKEKGNEETKKKKEKKKIVFMEKTEEIPNVEFPGE